MSSLDNIAVKKYEEFWSLNSNYSHILHLNYFDVNVKDKNVIYHSKPDLIFKYKRSENNNRARASDYGSGNKWAEEIRFETDSFAKAIGDFSKRWEKEKNDMKYPSPQ